MKQTHSPPTGIIATTLSMAHKCPAGLTCKSSDLPAAHEHGPATAHSNTIAGGASC